ncbi:MAG: redox-sensing transcriptional repressor Rex [Bacteroidales bacterium]|nr:redox-sensing transcriptional repressor Rex [Bacteroidales bacterium]
MSKQNTPSLVVMKSTLSRLPLYYSYISRLQAEGVESVSSALLAGHLNLNPVLVRKDLAQVSSVAGHPRTGFEVKQLLEDMSEYLGYNKMDEAILVGVGSMGRILLTNTKFAKFGLNIVVGFDKDPYLCGLQLDGKHILPMEKMEGLVQRMGIRIGIITVPDDQAQIVCDQMVKAGIKAIWNFAFVPLKVPEDVLVKNENLPSSLAVLAHKLAMRASVPNEINAII